jgi:tetratricopeptide (TPR) repeat protein
MGSVQNVVTLELLARLHPTADPERQVWWVHEPGAATRQEALPGVCLLPFWQLISRLSGLVARDLQKDRVARGRPARQLEGIGQLDADDVVWLRSRGDLVISADSGLLAIRTVLDRLVAVQPGLLEIAEQWRAWLDEDSAEWFPGSRFELHWGALFSEGAVFERVVSYRVFDAARFFPLCEGATAATALRSDMSVLLAAVGHVPGEDDPDAERIATLRRAVTHNRLDDFLALADPRRAEDARLVLPAFGAAIAAAPERRPELVLQRAELSARCPLADVRLAALVDAIDVVHEIRTADRLDDAVRLYRRLLDDFAGDFLEDNEFLIPWLRLLAHLSFLLIEKLDEPQAGLDLLLPRLQEFDAREASPVRDDETVGNLLARVRAHQDAAVARLQERGLQTPPGVGTRLSTADRARLDEAAEAFATALAEPDPARAVLVAQDALDLLEQRGARPDAIRTVEWRIDWARAVRDMGELERAATALRSIIDLCDAAPSVALGSSRGRASVALGMTYRQLGRAADEMGAYESFLLSPAAQEPTHATLVQVSKAHAFLAEALARSGDPTRAVPQYLAAARTAERLGDESRQTSMLTHAADTARIAGDEAAEKTIRARLEPHTPDRAHPPSRGFLGWFRGRA